MAKTKKKKRAKRAPSQRLTRAEIGEWLKGEDLDERLHTPASVRPRYKPSKGAVAVLFAEEGGYLARSLADIHDSDYAMALVERFTKWLGTRGYEWSHIEGDESGYLVFEVTPVAAGNPSHDKPFTMENPNHQNPMFEDAKVRRDQLEADVDKAAKRIDAFPKLASGLTPDSAKTPQWRQARADYDTAFARLRKFNQWFVRTFRSEIEAERAQRRSSKASLNPTNPASMKRRSSKPLGETTVFRSPPFPRIPGESPEARRRRYLHEVVGLPKSAAGSLQSLEARAAKLKPGQRAYRKITTANYGTSEVLIRYGLVGWEPDNNRIFIQRAKRRARGKRRERPNPELRALKENLLAY
jgi:hypothetical protein